LGGREEGEGNRGAELGMERYEGDVQMVRILNRSM